MDFKVGDKVRFTGKCAGDLGYYPKDNWIGEVLGTGGVNCLVKWGENSGVKAGPQNNYAWYCEKAYLELVEEENVMKYEVGEKVKFIDENAHEEDPGTYPPVGTIGTIVEVDPRDKEWTCRIDWGEKSGVERNPTYNGCVWWAPNSFIEKLPWWVSSDNEVASDEVGEPEAAAEVEETDDVAALAELVIKKQMEIQKLKEDNEKIVARNAELTELVAAFRNKGLEIVNLGVNKNV